jgi:SAM-dependent methyltransferase
MFERVRRLRGSGLKTRLLNPVDELCDQWLGVRTSGFLAAVGPAGSPHWQGHYVPTPYRKIIRTLRHVGIRQDDVFADLGCGLGRAVFAASWLGARRSVGVEIDSVLTDKARENSRRSRLRGRNIEFVCAPAQTYDFDKVSVLYMFHPFGEGTMGEVLERLGSELARRPRRLRIAYENPVCAELLDRSRYLARLGQWPVEKRGGSPYPVGFWRSN